ncbi:MAG: hypothetical protein HOQ03_03130 [Thermoleophilia bacterium]|nr:hypothetical protein [Thermoleophilia bacterium]
MPKPLRRFVSVVTPARAAGAVFAMIALVAIVYVRRESAADTGLDAEGNEAAYFSALLLVSAGAFVALAARHARPEGPAVPWYVVSVLLLTMAADELLGWHETLERRTGVDWQLLYGPVVVAAGVCALRMMWALRARPRVLATFVGGGTAWLVAQVLEKVQWSGDTLLHPGLIVPEELLEMTGSALFGVAMLAVIDSAARGPAPAAQPGESPSNASARASTT